MIQTAPVQGRPAEACAQAAGWPRDSSDPVNASEDEVEGPMFTDYGKLQPETSLVRDGDTLGWQ